MRGTVKGSDDGLPMAGVEVTLVDESTGAVKTTSTNEDGSFVFTNLQIGGPYHVTASLQGFKSSEETGIFLSANKVRDVSLAMHLQEEVIEVSSAPVVRSTSNRTVVSAVEIDELPSVGRDPRDVVRRNPEVSVEGRDRTLSIGGANTRFNSITVDGIRQDDDFGINLSGYPTRRSPIALSAIQELTVDSSPFDVHYGKFLGGNVNIVTKSGTNDFKGTLVGTYSSDSLLGNRSGNKRINVDYSEFRYGGTVGGPIIKDKLHFLFSLEGLNASTPTSVGPAGSDAVNITSKVTQDEMAMVQQIAKDIYKFNAGSPSQSLDEGDLKLFGKLDYVIDARNRATASFQRTGGNSIQQATATDTTLPLTSDWYDARDTLYTFSGRLFSDWSDELSTEVEANAKLVRSTSPPLNGNGFMQATITTPTGGRIVLGPDQFRHANSIDNDVFHGKAEANYLLKDHLVTGGFEYELLRINDLFVPGSNGVAQYGSIEDFMAMKPSSLTYSNAVTQNPQDGAAKWKNATWTAYAQDQYKISNELSVQAGARVELYTTSDHIARNQNFVNRYADTLGISNTENLNGRSIFMPRLGVSYLPIDHLNVRAGVGLYSGGTPNVWVTNNYGNDGVRVSSVTCPGAACPDASIINNFDGRNVPQALKDLVAAGNGNVDVLDPNFKIPSAWKAGIGADYSVDIPGLDEYGQNLGIKVNYTFTKIRDGVNWIDLRRDLAILPNNLPVGTTPDGRPLYSASFNATRGYDMMLTNTDHGYGHVASLQLEKSFPFGLYVAGSYAYQDVHEVNPATSSRSVSNYGIAALVDPNDPTDGVSIYERKHRLTGTIEYSHPIIGYFTDSSPWKSMRTALGLFVESRSGQPYSWTFGATENRNGNRTDGAGTKLGRIFGEDTTFSSRNRELFYVPTEAEVCVGPGGVAPPAGCNVVLSDGTPFGGQAATAPITVEQFNAFLKATGLDKYRGQIVPRNAFKSPWFNKLDMRFAQDLPNPVNDNRARFVVDIENVGNLLNHDWGRSRSVPFPYFAPAVDLDYDRANNKYIYSNLKSPNATTVDVLQSVWRVSIGLMYDF
ncbi:MAG TPA: TonB-dependent receptor [Kofleriaceae bacterium]|nr:TonB-dependent receptor [Kofleriaceae bacterium]